MIEPEAALQALRRRIEKEHSSMSPPREVWFWLGGDAMSSRGGWDPAVQVAVATVKGFLGTAPVIFAGLMPSLREGTWKDYDPDEFFYSSLAEFDLQDAHVTDLFKVRSRVKDVPLIVYDPEMLASHRDRFAEEARIITPAVVVAMGKQVLDVLRGWRFVVGDTGQYKFEVQGAPQVPVVETVHPSSTRTRDPNKRAERQARFREACAEIGRAHV